MALQTLKIGKREFVLLGKRDFEKLAAQAQRQTEDDYWTNAALEAEAKARARKEKPIPFEEIERELDARPANGGGESASRSETLMVRRRIWRVELLTSARRELLALRNPIQNRIRGAICSLADDPTQLIRKLD